MPYSVLSRNCGGCKSQQKVKTLSQRLRHNITIEQQSTVPDAHGQHTTTWTAVTGLESIKASVEPLRGREFFAADQINSEVTARIRIRYRSGITAKMRVSFESRYYNIEAIIDPEERHEELQLMCSEGANDG